MALLGGTLRDPPFFTPKIAVVCTGFAVREALHLRSCRFSVCSAWSIFQVPQVNRVFWAVGSAADAVSGAHFQDGDSVTSSFPGCARSS